MRLKEKFLFSSGGIAGAVVGTATGLVAGHIPLVGAAFVAAATPVAPAVLAVAFGLATGIAGLNAAKHHFHDRKMEKLAKQNQHKI